MTAEQAALLRKAQASLQAARLLAAQGFYDFAVSRAYYTMFYVAEAFLLEKGLAFSKHSSVISAFGLHFAKTGHVPQELHRYLIEGQDTRNTGDYDIGPGLSAEETTQQLTHAEQFLNSAEHFLGPIPPADDQSSLSPHL